MGRGERLQATTVSSRAQLSRSSQQQATAPPPLARVMRKSDMLNYISPRRDQIKDLTVNDNGEMVIDNKMVKNMNKSELQEIASNLWRQGDQTVLTDLFRRSPKYQSLRGAWEQGLGFAARAIKEHETDFNQDELKSSASYQTDHSRQTRQGYIHDSFEAHEQARRARLDQFERRDLKESYNTMRNNAIEYLMLREHPELVPTFSDIKGIDYYIDNRPVDQKVTEMRKQFKADHGGEDWRQYALDRKDDPQFQRQLAQDLLENQGQDRFNEGDRLFVIALDPIEDIDQNKLVEQINNANVHQSQEINFKYRPKGYKTAKKFTSQATVLFVHR